MVLQALTDAVTALTTAVAALNTKVDALIASSAGSASPAEQQTVADQLTAVTKSVTDETAKLP